MGEPSGGIVGGNGLKGEADGLLEGVLSTSAQATEARLDLGECLLDGG